MATRTLPAGTALPVLMATLAIAFFSVMDAVMKDLTLAIGTYNAVFWRMLLGVAMSAIFYLGSRGVPRDVAKQLIVTGFFQEVLEQVGFGELRGELEQAVAEKVTR